MADDVVANVAQVDQYEDWFANEVAVFLETDVDLHLRPGRRSHEHQQEAQAEPHKVYADG